MGTDWKQFLRSVTFCLVPMTVLAVGMEDRVSAQGMGASLGSLFPVPIVGSFEPITTFEKFCGPILPKCDIGNTFRSEVGVGYKWASTRTANLTAPIEAGSSQIDLRTWSALDQAPPYVEVLADLRLWRLGFRAAYFYFDNLSHNDTLGKLLWNGARLGLDFDAVHHEWLTFGASVDYYLIDPRFDGRLLVSTDGSLDPNRLSINDITVTGQKPLTWGLYFRYMPPEILNIPVHFEAFGKFPITGSKYSSYGALLSFRPQIYRFDLACKLGVEWSELKFSQSTTPTSDERAIKLLPQGNYQLDLQWQLYTIEFAAYF